MDYVGTPRTVALTDVTVTDADHLMILASVERPTADCNVVFKLTVDGVEYEAIEAQSVTLGARWTGTVSIEAELTGTTEMSPTLHPDIILLSAKRDAASDYVTRSMLTNSGGKIDAYYDAYIPSGASIDAYYETTTDTWVSLPVVDTTALGDGWTEYKCEVTASLEPETRIKLTLNGDAHTIPIIENLRVAIT
jgi:hypothetical protein